MRKLLFLSGFIPLIALGQFPEDALRYGYPVLSGTARNLAIGGAMGSLGGDITAAYINPAGIGMYKNSEFVVSPGFLFNSNNFTYRNSKTSANNSGFGLGTSGFVSGRNNPRYRSATSSAFAITINQTANFRNVTNYQGLNNQSSWSEQYIEQLIRDNATTFRQVEQDYILGSSLAWWTFLIDSIRGSNGEIAGYQSIVPLSPTGATAIRQANRLNDRGATNEVALSFANNYKDKLHLGVSFGLPIYNFRSEQTYREEDATGDTDNDFNYFEFQQQARTTGFGLNAKLGLIYRPVEKIRLGIAVHTPTFATLTDRYSASMETDSENFTNQPQPQRQTTAQIIERNVQANSPNPDRGVYDYSISTPFRFIGSASVVLNEVKDIRKQRGFISADVEYVTHNTMRYRSVNEGDELYYSAVNDEIKAMYRGAINLRLGGELKFEKVMVRAGLASIGNPYSDASGLSAKRTLVSGGLGYRHMGMFVDLAYVHAFIRDSHVPYRLEDKDSPIADSRNTRGNVVLTFGFKL